MMMQEMMGHLEAGNAAGIEELTRRAASAVVTSPAGRAEEVLGRLTRFMAVLPSGACMPASLKPPVERLPDITQPVSAWFAL